MSSISCGLYGLYKFIVSRDDSIVRETEWQHNVITLVGLDRIGTGPYITQCQVGTGTTPPVNTDTSLAALLGTSTNILKKIEGFFYDDPSAELCFDKHPYGYGRWTFQFAKNTVLGTLTEAGVGWDSGLFSRIVLTAPVSIEVDETLEVVYELRNATRYHGGENPWEHIEFMIKSSYYAGYMGPANIPSADTNFGWGVTGLAGAITDVIAFDDTHEANLEQVCTVPQGAQMPADSVTLEPYVPGSHRRSSIVTFGPNTANFTAGIGSFLIGTSGLGCFQYASDPICESPECSPTVYGPIFKVAPDELILRITLRWYENRSG